MTVRGLSEQTRAGLRRIAAAKGVSVEALARESLTSLAGSRGGGVVQYEQTPPAFLGFGQRVTGWNVMQQSESEFGPSLRERRT